MNKNASSSTYIKSVAKKLLNVGRNLLSNKLYLIVFFFQIMVAKSSIQINFYVHHKYKKILNNNEEDTTLSEQKYKISSIFGNNFIEHAFDNKKIILDFNKKSFFYVTNNQGQKSDYYQKYFHQIIEKREKETTNKILILKPIKKNNLTSFFNNKINSSDPTLEKNKKNETTLVEHSFSIKKKKDSKIYFKIINNEKKYYYNSDILLSHTIDGAFLGLEQVKKYTQYLRYVYGIHPDILNEIGKMKIIPKTMEIFFYNRTKDNYLIKLTSIKKIDYIYSLKNLNEKTYKDNRIDDLINRARNTSEKFREDRYKKIIKKAVEQGNKANYLDSFLYFFEYYLSSGREMPKEMKINLDIFQSEENVNLLYQCFRTFSVDDIKLIKKALKNLIFLEPRAKKQKHMIWIYQANIHFLLKNSYEANELLLNALNINPLITGAWKDLGDIYYSELDFSTAWKCWNIARYLNKEHKNLKDITRIENEIEKKYPEYFIY